MVQSPHVIVKAGPAGVGTTQGGFELSGLNFSGLAKPCNRNSTENSNFKADQHVAQQQSDSPHHLCTSRTPINSIESGILGKHIHTRCPGPNLKTSPGIQL